PLTRGSQPLAILPASLQKRRGRDRAFPSCFVDPFQFPLPALEGPDLEQELAPYYEPLVVGVPITFGARLISLGVRFI
ncbi:MAG: hypothetical protein ACP5UU_06260, partial [Thermoprotei archaeon]